MREKYESPIFLVEQFASNEYVATCSSSILECNVKVPMTQDGNGGLVVKDSDGSKTLSKGDEILNVQQNGAFIPYEMCGGHKSLNFDFFNGFILNEAEYQNIVGFMDRSTVISQYVADHMDKKYYTPATIWWGASPNGKMYWHAMDGFTASNHS